VQKKQRIEDLSSLVPSSQSNSIDEQSVPLPSLRVKLNEKKRRKNLINIIMRIKVIHHQQYRQHRKTKKHHHRRLSSPSLESL
jgi:hypothetical protein